METILYPSIQTSFFLENSHKEYYYIDIIIYLAHLFTGIEIISVSDFLQLETCFSVNSIAHRIYLGKYYMGQIIGSRILVS